MYVYMNVLLFDMAGRTPVTCHGGYVGIHNYLVIMSAHIKKENADVSRLAETPTLIN